MHRSRLRVRVVVCGVVLAVAAARAIAAEPGRGDVFPMLDDAQLTDVFFLDSDLGWAVGERGAVWHTDDGGRQWRLQVSSVACRLESVFFLDSQNGWIVGGEIQPYLHRSAGVVLRTRDGGRQWTPVPGLTLPLLKRVHFWDARAGWAVGHASAMYPAGIFQTTDGGRSWNPLPGGKGESWVTGDFVSPAVGVVAGAHGSLGRVQETVVEPQITPAIGLRPVRDLRLADDHLGGLVGDGGLILLTTDGGRQWSAPPGPLPAETAELMDFHGIAWSEGHLWIAGAPGSLVFHSADGGRTWEAQRTGQTIPLRRLAFIDAQRGWAVGDLGTILATRDGGQTWRRQRAGGSRPALLGFHSETSRLPFELMALYAGNEGYLSAWEVLYRRDLNPGAEGPVEDEDQLQQAVGRVGGSVATRAWQFPLRPPGLHLALPQILADWEPLHAGAAPGRLEELVVRRIRQWRPDVVVTEPVDPRGGDPIGHLTNQVVLEGVRRAADPTAYPAHASGLGLEPWTVKKVFCGEPQAAKATLQITPAQLATRLGCSVAEFAASGRAMVEASYRAPPATLGYQLVVNRIPQEAGRTDLFGGIFLQPGSESRRLLGTPPLSDLESLRKSAQKQRNIEQLVAVSVQRSSNGAAWLGQLQDLTSGLTPEAAARILFQLAERFGQNRQPDLAAETYQQLIEHYADQPLTEVACWRLIQYYTSSELGWRLRRDAEFAGSDAALAAAGPVAAVQFAGGAAEALEAGRPSSSNRPNAVERVEYTPNERAGRALAIGKQLQRLRPELVVEPPLRLALAAAQRSLGQARDAERTCQQLAQRTDDSPWSACGAAEVWLAQGRGLLPRPVCECRPALEKPHLDGTLDDPVWTGARPVELASALHDDAAWPAAVMLAYDHEYLYLAFSCRKVPGVAYTTGGEPRPRDGDLTARDRVELLLDLDRDYATFYRLAVDHRSWTNEACVGDDSWNPTWFVAGQDDTDTWTIEAAIPFSQLASRVPAAGDAWAIGLQRIIPGVGLQSLSQPAAVEPRPEGFSLVVFQ